MHHSKAVLNLSEYQFTIAVSSQFHSSLRRINKMAKRLFLVSLILILVVAIHSSALGVNVFRSTAVNAGTSVGVGIVTTPPMGRACGLIGGAGFESPAGGCKNVNGPIPPNRTVTFSDAAGNSIDARAVQLFRAGK